MISKTLSTSEKRASLHLLVPDLAEFCQQLYPLLIAHADDFGRLQGDVFTVKHLIDPTSPRLLPDFERALTALDDVGLILRYESDNGGVTPRRLIQIANFDPHQLGLHKRTGSEFPAPPGGLGGDALDASEERVEEAIADALKTGRLTVGDFTVTAVERQVRKGSSYLDLVADTTVGVRLLVEVKRQRVTLNAISQVRAYRALMLEPVVPVVIGHGLVAELTLPISDVVIGIYDDALFITTANPITVNSQVISLNHIPSELKGRELKGTEPKKNGSSEPSGSKPDDGSPTVSEFPTVGSDGGVYRLSEAQVSEWAEFFPGLDVRQ